MLFKFGFDFFKTFCLSGVFIILCFFFKVNSVDFLHNRVATLDSTPQHVKKGQLRKECSLGSQQCQSNLVVCLDQGFLIWGSFAYLKG